MEYDLGQRADCCHERSRNIATRVTRPAGKPPVAEVTKRFVAYVRRLGLAFGEQGAGPYYHHDYNKGRFGSEKRVCGNAPFQAQPPAIPPETGTWSKTSTWGPRRRRMCGADSAGSSPGFHGRPCMTAETL
ncbi:uncharacterized protein LOC144120078 [Amblyomma americanum]